MKNVKFILAVSLVCIASPGFAGEEKWTCKNGKATRTIEVSYQDKTKKAPCEVKYTKEDGAATTKWSAQNDGSFCVEKAKGFSEKLGGLGWTCE